MKPYDYILFGLLSFLWGSAFLAIRVSVHEINPTDMVAIRLVIGAIALWAYTKARGISLVLPRCGWLVVVFASVFGNALPFWLISTAETEVDSGLAALIMGIAPIVTLVLAPMFLADETFDRQKKVGATVGFAGVILLVGPSVLFGIGAQVLPQFALLLAALCYAGTTLFTRKFAQGTPEALATLTIAAGAVVMLPLALFDGLNISSATPVAMGSVLYLALGPTALAAVLYYVLLPRMGAGRLQQVNYAVPVIGTLLGILVLGEQPTWNVWLALPIIIGAVALVTRRA